MVSQQSKAVRLALGPASPGDFEQQHSVWQPPSLWLTNFLLCGLIHPGSMHVGRTHLQLYNSALSMSVVIVQLSFLEPFLPSFCQTAGISLLSIDFQPLVLGSQ